MFCTKSFQHLDTQHLDGTSMANDFPAGSDHRAIALAYGEALLQFLDSLTEPVIPWVLHPRCALAKSREDVFDVCEPVLGCAPFLMTLLRQILDDVPSFARNVETNSCLFDVRQLIVDNNRFTSPSRHFCISSPRMADQRDQLRFVRHSFFQIHPILIVVAYSASFREYPPTRQSQSSSWHTSFDTTRQTQLLALYHRLIVIVYLFRFLRTGTLLY